MRLAVPTEPDPSETRVAATPETVKKYTARGAEVAVHTIVFDEAHLRRVLRSYPGE
jgi:NAD/NADP transhydrogenase alpha subunit